MTPEHVIYVPSMLMLGLICGWVLGSRAVRAEIEKKKRKMKE